MSLDQLLEGSVIPWQFCVSLNFHVPWSLVLLPCIWNVVAFELIFSFLLQHRAVISVLGTWTSTKALSSAGGCLRQPFPVPSRLQPGEDGARWWVPAGPTAGTKVSYLLQTHGWAQTPCHMMLDSTAPKRALLSIGGCQIIYCWEMRLNQEMPHLVIILPVLFLKWFLNYCFVTNMR